MSEHSALLDQNTGWLLITIFGLVWIGLGLWWGRKARNVEGYMLAGRNVGMALGTATAVATWITSNTTMLAPQFALELGVWGMLAYSTASFGLFLFAPLARRIRQLMPNGYTSVEFMRRRYGMTAHVLFLVISLFYSLTWMVSMGMAGGILLEALAGIPYLYGMTVILTVCVTYTVFGGLYAVIGTDFIQSTIILIGIVVVAVLVLRVVPSMEIHDTLVSRRPMLLSALLPAAIMAIFNNMLFGLGEVFHSNVWWSRAFAMRDGVGFKAYMTSGFLWLPIPIVAGFLGLATFALDINVARPDVAGPLVAANVLGSAGAVLVFIVCFCSLASSIDSLLAATGDLVTKEIVQPLFARSADDRTLRMIASAVVVGVGVITWAVCVPNIDTLARVLFFAGPLVGSAIWPIITGLFWRRANAVGAVAGMLGGSAAGLVAYFTIGWYCASLIGTAVSCIIVLAGIAIAPGTFAFSRLREAPAR